MTYAIVDDDELAAELSESMLAADALRSWSELRDAILAERGICADPDYSIHSMPRAIYRATGNPADVIAARLDFDRADDMIDLANRLFDRARDATRHARRQDRSSRRSTHVPAPDATLPASPPQRGKLSRADADLIRRAVADGADRRDLARYYHVHTSTIGDIVRRVYLK